MSFQSLSFLVFLAVTAAVCLGLGRRDRRWGQWALSAACMVFYLWDLPARAALGGALVLLGGGMAAWAAAGSFRTHPARKRAVMTLMVCYFVGMLALYRYIGAATVRQAPLGLSFFTFQQLWLLHEAYTGAFVLQRGDPWWLSVFFFPTVSSGPILKPQAIFPQLRGEGFLRPTWHDAAAGLYAICCGSVKKVLLADNLGVVVDNGWAGLAQLSAPGAWLVILGYTLQLYLDFSGYCDIAAGCARLLGLRLPVNFDAPYRSLSVGEFWKRWHITLTSFLRECVYFPLGGSRGGAARTYGNILLVFLISGVWHGAGWTFVVWGALHGLAQIAERAWGPGRDRLPRWLRWGLTFAFVNLAWVFFRAPDLTAAAALLGRAAGGGLAGPGEQLTAGLLTGEADAIGLLLPAAAPWAGTVLLAALYGAALAAALWPRSTPRRMETFRPTAWRCALAAGMAVSVLSYTGVSAFIYSNF